MDTSSFQSLHQRKMIIKNFQLTQWLQPELLQVVTMIFGLLIVASFSFYIAARFKPSKLTTELQVRTRSWWIMAIVFVTASLIHPIVTFCSIAFLSFVALRELYSIIKPRTADRFALLLCYLAIPIQYFIAYKNWYDGFLVFIPIGMHLLIPFALVVGGETKHIIRSMSTLPTSLMLLVFGLSHLAFLVHLPTLESYAVGGKGLLLFLVLLTELNDVAQFVWGKLFGNRKVIPKISPNKTWEGLIGGIVTTILLGYSFRFLTPLSEVQVLWVSGIIAITGFMGDIIISAIKREIGLKDTGNSIPGHGGVLDRIDSLTITAPIFFHLVYQIAYV